MNISIQEILAHYNIIGLGIGVAVGIASKDLIFSFISDIVIPLIQKHTFISIDVGYTLNIQKFMATFITFLLVMAVILIILTVVLRPIVEKELTGKDAEDDEDEKSGDENNFHK